ncbi:MAG: SusC/RagA family TonB-linked outer membrane protein [Bacteroidales bacterium]|jgi:TonB-linked SusC/RagA family outer membrane protein|nr:SusC/RagA family TonB-linked outer membrane protein [Bacteroidales bacterium]
MKKIPALVALLLIAVQVNSQQLIRGKITDDTNSSLPGVSIQVKNTLRGTFSDIAGNYSISASPADTLVFSMVGMTTQRIAVGSRTVIDVKLVTEAMALQEVVVVGYGTQKVKDLTAPIVTMKGEELNKQMTSNAMQALQGKIAGVQIINSGAPGAGSSVKIRGVGSIGDYANPLYVVDGVFVDNIDFLAAGDIEDLTVLKDASAAAIYGVRAANGVILVTTKKGKTTKPSVSYDGYVGIQIPVNIMPMATTEQYVGLMNEANENVPGYVPKVASSYPASTDWYQELVRPAGTNSHSLDISGISDNTSYSVGGSYYFQQGIMDTKNDYQRFNFRGRLDQKVSDRFKIGLNTVVSKYSRNIANDGAFFSAYVNPPVYPVYDDNNTGAYPVRFGSPQTYGFGNQYGNPVAAAYYNDDKEKGNKLVFSVFGEYSIIREKLTYRLSYNTDLNNWNTRNYEPEFNVGGSQGVRKSSLSKTSGSSSKQIIDNLLTYKYASGKTNFSLLLGQSTRMERWEYLTGSAISVPGIDEQAKYLSTGSFRDRYAYDGAAVYNGLSFFTRATYNNGDKYLATVTFRADASSKYQQKWGYFPSFGIGWILSEEDFMSNQKLFSYLKFRASWGMLGNDNVPANSAVVLGQTGAGSSAVFGDQLVDGVGAQTVVQNYLEWEVVSEFDLGFDFELAGGKISGETDYYHRVTNNVVFYAPIATGGGTAELLGNNGSVLNQGIELNINYKNKISDDISYNIGFNATTIFNKVLKLEGKESIPGAWVRSGYTTLTKVGHPIGSFYGFEVDGVYESEAKALQDPVSQGVKDKGFFKYRDQNGDKVIDDKDKVFLGSAIPWLIAGLDFSLNYHRMDLSIGLQGQVGNKIVNAKRMNRDVFTDGNYDQDFYKNHWTTDNKSDKYPSAEAYNYSYTQQANDFFVQDGSYIRIQNVQLGYTTEKIKFIPKFRIYLAAQRPFTFFTYDGFTPEVGGTPIASGVDNSVYPMQAIYSLGLKLNF